MVREVEPSASPSPRGARSKATVGVGFLIGIALFAIFFKSPILRVYDSKYTLLLSEQLLLNQSFELDAYFSPRVDSSHYPGVKPGRELPRHIRRRNGHLYYRYPAGSALLSIPLVAIMRPLGVSTIDAEGRYVLANEERMQKLGAALLMALAGVVFFATARLSLPLGWSAALAVTGSLGTSVWSTASRSLQAHAWLILLLALAIYLVMRAETGRYRLRPVCLGVLLSLAFYVRPTAAVVAVPMWIYVWARFGRRDAAWLGGVGALLLALFLAYCRLHFGRWLPVYYMGRGLALETFPYGFVSQLVSPSRGILVFSPFLGVVGYAAIRYRAFLQQRALLTALASASVLHLVVVSFQLGVHAGAYGPRYLTDVVPLLVAMSILVLRAGLDGHVAKRSSGSERGALRRVRGEVLALGAGVALSVLIHGAGAISLGGVWWNQLPVPLSADPMRVFDWRRPQWLCALFPELLPPADESVKLRPVDALGD